jgi:ATP-dependent helicase/nuclease subunit A
VRVQRPDDAARDARATRLGEALHRTLEWASQAGQRQPLVSLLAAASQAFGLDAPAREQLARSAEAILASPECRPFFDPAGLRWAGNEVAVALGTAEGRIDRLVQLNDGVWWVLDYKLGATPEAQAQYHEQMQSYVEAVQTLQPNEPVRAALISGEGRLVIVG